MWCSAVLVWARWCHGPTGFCVWSKEKRKKKNGPERKSGVRCGAVAWRASSVWLKGKMASLALRSRLTLKLPGLLASGLSLD